MQFVYQYLFTAIWISWAIFWRATTWDVKVDAWRESWPSRLSHMVPLAIAGLLLWLPSVPVPGLGRRLWPSTVATFWVGAIITITGLVITVWARIYIGRNWSGAVTLKAEHELITSGPYAFVRHPIYTGLLLAFVGSAIARGDGQGFVAVAIASLTLWFKLRFEERGMRKQFGNAYEVYSQSVAALIPFVL